MSLLPVILFSVHFLVAIGSHSLKLVSVVSYSAPSQSLDAYSLIMGIKEKNREIIKKYISKTANQFRKKQKSAYLSQKSVTEMSLPCYSYQSW